MAVTSMTSSDLAQTIDAAWEGRAGIGPATAGELRGAVDHTIDLLDRGEARVAEKHGDEWQVHQWLKKAVLLSFRLTDMGPIGGGPGGAPWSGPAARSRR